MYVITILEVDSVIVLHLQRTHYWTTGRLPDGSFALSKEEKNRFKLEVYTEWNYYLLSWDVLEIKQ